MMTIFALRLPAVLAVVLGCASLAHGATVCTPPAPEALRDTWQAFRKVTLAGDPAQAVKFYRFPLKLRPPYHDQKPLVIARPVFLHNYKLLFLRGPADSEIVLYTDLKKTTGNEAIPSYVFDAARCTATARVEDYVFTYGKDGAWKVDALFYAGDFDIAKDSGLDKIQD